MAGEVEECLQQRRWSVTMLYCLALDWAVQVVFPPLLHLHLHHGRHLGARLPRRRRPLLHQGETLRS